MGFFDILSKKTAEQYFSEGINYEQLGRHSEAVKSYNWAIAIDPLHDEALKHRSHCLLELNRPSEACDSYYRGQTAKRAKVVASCEQEIALDPNNAKAWFKHGVALYTLGLYSEAITSYDKAIALDPNYSAAKQNREVALKKQSQQ